MSQSTPLHAMPVLDVPFPRTVGAAPSSPQAATSSSNASRRAPMALPSTQKTMLGVAPSADDHDGPANRPTVPDGQLSRVPAGLRPGRTIVGVGPAMRDVDDTPEIVASSVVLDEARVEARHEPAFAPSAFARDPGLGAAESIRLPRRRIEPADWLLLTLIVAIVGVVLTLLL